MKLLTELLQKATSSKRFIKCISVLTPVGYSLLIVRGRTSLVCRVLSMAVTVPGQARKQILMTV